MATATIDRLTMRDLLQQLGNVPPGRVWLRPAPGKATARDVLRVRAAPERRLCELVDGVLVEKPMGAWESLLAARLITLLGAFVAERALGIVLGPDGMLRILPRQVRIPDVCFISWERLPEGRFPDEQIPGLVPDLAVEVLSPSNTKGEMARKLKDYFRAGVQVAWLIDPKTESAEVYTSPTEVQRLGKNQVLDGGELLPGFRLVLKQLFAQAERPKKK
jgi:Uma2 family endonuclease